MREFTNVKARELFVTSLKIDEQSNKVAEQEIKRYGYCVTDTAAEMATEAAGLRVLADDIEDGLIDENEIEI